MSADTKDDDREAEKPSAAMAKYLKSSSKFLTIEGVQKGLQFKPTNTDVIISASPKSGSTWLQQICHQLRSGGDMNFDELDDVAPALETAFDAGYIDLNVSQGYTPRIFKTHFWYPTCPKGPGKYVVVVRRPSDVAMSYYHFNKNWAFDPDEISFQEFVKWVYLQHGIPGTPTHNASHMHHILSWYPHRHDNNVLWIHYEDMQQDLPQCIRLLAQFLNIGQSDEKLIELVAHNASYDYMKTHWRKFDLHQLKVSRNAAAGIDEKAGMTEFHSRVQLGGRHIGKNLTTPEILKQIEQRWVEVMKTETGCDTYDDFRHKVNTELNRSFS